MIFPELQNKKTCQVNLNEEAKLWLAKQANTNGENPLLNPELCQDMVSAVHKKYDVDFSYGGWMEDRSFLWKGSYLEDSNAFIHLGVDLNVPAGTLVAIDFDAEVVRIDDDYPEEGGWGPRVIVRHESEPVYIVYAHLDRGILCKLGDKLKSGAAIAKVGAPPLNGNWFPHLHVQIVEADYFELLQLRNTLWELDGYGNQTEMAVFKERFRDPIQFVRLQK